MCSAIRSIRRALRPTPTLRSPAAARARRRSTHSAALLFFLTGLQPVSVAALTESFELAVDLADAVVTRFDNGAVGSLGSTGSVLPGTGGDPRIPDLRRSPATSPSTSTRASR